MQMSQGWLHSVIDSAARGEERPTVAALRLLLHENDGDVDDALDHALRSAGEAGAARLTKMATLLADARRDASALRAVAAAGPGLAMADGELIEVRSWAAAFDQAARINHSAASALHSLGDAERLAAATREVCAFLDARSFITETTRVIDIGAGGGRILEAIAPWIAYGIGIDISAQMLASARPHDNIAFLQTDGRNLRAFKDNSFDLAIAVESFPYLVASGLDEVHIAEAARVLAPGGALVIMNYSYRGDRNEDRMAFVAACAVHDLAPTILAEQPFELWDGTVFAARRLH
jgi:SAM-dependent methyltransferase